MVLKSRMIKLLTFGDKKQGEKRKGMSTQTKNIEQTFQIDSTYHISNDRS